MKLLTSLSSFVFVLSVNAQTNTTEEEFCGYTAINGLTSGRNNEKCGDLLDDAFLPYNAMYNGTLKLQLTGNAAECPQNTYTMADYTVGIGPMKIAGNESFDRSTYDSNPFYLWMKYQTDENITAGFLSSSDYFLTESQWWTLTSTKSGDGFDITGNYTGELAAVSNVYNYPTDDCWTVNIYNHIVGASTTSATNYNYWTLTGRLTTAKVKIVVDQFIMEDGVEYHSIFTYEGTPNPGEDGAKLVTSESVPTTDLALKGTTDPVDETANGTSGTSGTNGTNGTNGTSGASELGVGRSGGVCAVTAGLILAMAFSYL